MKKTGVFTLLLGLALVCGSVYAASGEAVQQENSRREKLAVLDLEANYGVEGGFAKALSVLVRDEIHSFGEYEVMSTADLRAVMSREAMLQAMGCDDDGAACLVSFGRAIGTRFMVAGSLSKLGSTYNISLRILDTKGDNAGVVKRASGSCKCSEDELIAAVQQTAAELMGRGSSSAKEEEAKEPFTDPTTGMEFVYIKDGCFQMGQSEKEKKRLIAERGLEKYHKYYRRERPRHEVCVAGFYMGKKEVTLGQWRDFIDSTSYRTDAERDVGRVGCLSFKDKKWAYHDGRYWNNVGFSQSVSQPVVCVSYNDVSEFISWLNRGSEKRYRLPTEAEWEYAARGETSSIYYWGDDNGKDVCKYANHSDRSRDPTAIYKCNDGYKWSSPVGSFKPNNFGLYDMLGNVWEWTGDWYGKDYYNTGVRENPSGASSGSRRVDRGGSWRSRPWSVRAARRSWDDPDNRKSHLGFRLVLSEGK